MGKLGTAAMAVGQRDVNAGVAWLAAEAKRAKVTLLSANLREGGKAPFPASQLVTVGSSRVALIGVTAPGPTGVKGLEAGPSFGPALAEAKRLRARVDLVVVLAAVPYADALQLAGESKGLVDLVLQSYDGQGPMVAQTMGQGRVVGGGERGRQLGIIDFALGGAGPLTDLGELAREAQLAEHVGRLIEQRRARLATAPDEKSRKEIETSIARLESSQKAHLEAARGGGKRSLQLRWRVLGADVADDPSIAAQVRKLEPG